MVLLYTLFSLTPPLVLSAVELIIKKKMEGATPNIQDYIQKAFNKQLYTDWLIDWLIGGF